MCSSRYVLSKVQVRSMATTTYSAQCCLARIAEGKLKQVTGVLQSIAKDEECADFKQ